MGDHSLFFLRETVKYNNETLKKLGSTSKQDLSPITEIEQIEQPKSISESVKKEIEKKIIVPKRIIEEKQIIKEEPITSQKPTTTYTEKKELKKELSQVSQQSKTPSSPGWFTYVWEGIANFFQSIYNFIFPQS